jgi:hypothetical protein
MLTKSFQYVLNISWPSRMKVPRAHHMHDMSAASLFMIIISSKLVEAMNSAPMQVHYLTCIFCHLSLWNNLQMWGVVQVMHRTALLGYSTHRIASERSSWIDPKPRLSLSLARLVTLNLNIAAPCIEYRMKNNFCCYFCEVNILLPMQRLGRFNGKKRSICSRRYENVSISYNNMRSSNYYSWMEIFNFPFTLLAWL